MFVAKAASFLKLMHGLRGEKQVAVSEDQIFVRFGELVAWHIDRG